MQSTAKWIGTVLLSSILLLCSSPLSAALRSKSVPVRMKSHSATRLSRTRSGRSLKSRKPRYRGQQAIDQERTLQIQQALIRDHYLNGDPSGEWDQATREAMVRLQRENNWQTKVVPDSRALIKLGLGPSPQNLLNPESAALASVQPSANISSTAGAN
jgi:peptidoglycan hydrolase-like protein with peptidoglycan-binding domain